VDLHPFHIGTKKDDWPGPPWSVVKGGEEKVTGLAHFNHLPTNKKTDEKNIWCPIEKASCVPILRK